MKRLNLRLLLVLLALSLALPTTFAQRRADLVASHASPAVLKARGVETISASQMKTYLSFIASDEMEGRDTPSRGLDTVAKFIAGNLRRWGLKPMGDDGTFFQNITLRRDVLDATQSSARINGQDFKMGEDFLPLNVASAALSGPFVFAGSGWVVKGKGLDSYQGIDVKDKVIVVVGLGLPRGITRTDLAGGRQGVDWIGPTTYGQQHGAKGVLVIPDANALLSWDQMRQRTQPVRMMPEKFMVQPNAPQLPWLLMSIKMTRALFEGEPADAVALANGAEVAPFDLKTDKNGSITVTVKSERPKTQNVVAVWGGRDPALKSEYVALGAHYDHIGVCAPGGPDSICNGADDDGSGTTALLSIAEALSHAKQRPKRSILFVWHCGEEKGLWGSRYFTENPTVPLDKIVTQLNIDMIGRTRKEDDTNPRDANLSGPNTVYVIGSKMMSTELGELSESVNKSFLNLTFDYRYDDPGDPNRFFYRSDHYNYARRGIPIIFYFDGVHQDYHQPGDEPQKIDYDKMERIARTVYMTLWEIASRPTRPKIDKQLQR